MDAFTCFLPKVRFGCGELQNIGTYVRDIGQKAFLAIDPFLDEAGFTKRVISLLRDVAVETVVYSKIDPDPDCFGVD
jgi:alcohol dehydrogenase class IV